MIPLVLAVAVATETPGYTWKDPWTGTTQHSDVPWLYSHNGTTELIPTITPTSYPTVCAQIVSWITYEEALFTTYIDGEWKKKTQVVKHLDWVTCTPTPINSHSTGGVSYPLTIVPGTSWSTKPNPEATCVAVGHRWVTDGCETAPTVYHHDKEHLMQWCRRCKLWREKP